MCEKGKHTQAVYASVCKCLFRGHGLTKGKKQQKEGCAEFYAEVVKNQETIDNSNRNTALFWFLRESLLNYHKYE